MILARTDIRSEINGKVWKIEAAAGAIVDAEDPVIILESMKMEIPVVAPKRGRVADILVGEGDEVEEGDVVATLEDA